MKLPFRRSNRSFPKRQSFSEKSVLLWRANDDSYDDIEFYTYSVGPGDKRWTDYVIGVLRFQKGTIPEAGMNGVTVESVLEVCRMRLSKLDDKFPCNENKQAIAAITTALWALDARTTRRKAAGIEGQHTEEPNA